MIPRYPSGPEVTRYLTVAAAPLNPPPNPPSPHAQRGSLHIEDPPRPSSLPEQSVAVHVRTLNSVQVLRI